MFHTFKALASDAVMQRLALLANHVLAAEPAATERLRPHAGRHLRLEATNWPSLLPALPALAFDITPAGLLEWRGDSAEAAEALPPADLHIAVDASNPALALLQGLAGQKPNIDITGDAQLAADVSWLIDNLRWDIADDLSRLVGHTPARELARLGGWVATGLRDVAGRLGARASRPGGTG
jgi:ubiquinone biosynthesis protein UbiJ